MAHLPENITNPWLRTFFDPNMTHEQILSLIDPNSPLPYLEPLPEPPPYSAEREINSIPFSQSDPKLAAVEIECREGDSNKASASIDELIREGQSVRSLSTCLDCALLSDKFELGRKLLRLGVPINQLMTRRAVLRKSLESMSLLFEYGWDINKEQAWCEPGALA